MTMTSAATVNGKTTVCLACGSQAGIVSHHPMGHNVVPDFVIPLCKRCHAALHRRHPKLWRSPCLVPGEGQRLAVLRFAETAEFVFAGTGGMGLVGARSHWITEGLDRAAEMLLRCVEHQVEHQLVIGRFLKSFFEQRFFA